MDDLTKDEFAVQKALGTLNEYVTDITVRVTVPVTITGRFEVITEDSPNEEGALNSVTVHLNNTDETIEWLISGVDKTFSEDFIKSGLDITKIHKRIVAQLRKRKVSFTLGAPRKT